MVVSTEHISMTPGVCGGRPRIVGHRVRVQDVVVCHEWWGMSPEEIVDQFPTITLSDVFAALTYYFDHREQIDRDLAADGALAEAMKKQYPSRLDALQPNGDAADKGASDHGGGSISS